LSNKTVTKQKGKSSDRMLRLFNSLQWLNEQRHLYSIRTAFISAMPLMIVGAFAVVINQFPVPAYQEFMAGLFGERWRMLGTVAFNATTQIVTLFVIWSICSNLAQWYNDHKRRQVHAGICGMVGLASYVAMALPLSAEAIPFTMVGATGLFVAMLVGILSAEAFVQIVSLKRESMVLSDDPNVAVPQSFASIMPAIYVVGGFALVRVILAALGVEAPLTDLVTDLLRTPYENTDSSPLATGMLFNVSTHLMWLFGIHGNNVLDGIAQTVFAPAMAENVAAVAAGLPAPNMITKTLYDVFVYMGGSGTTLGLLLALAFFGRARSNRTLMRFALPTSIFNINEPLVFGIPIVLNPIYAIPFVLTPVVMFSTTVLAMTLGWVPYTTAEVSWATPVFFSGYVATGSAAGVILQVVNLALAVLIYAPFVRLGEKMATLRFNRAYKELVDTVTGDYSGRQLISRVDEVGAVARRLANQIDNGISGDEMYLNYQPIVDSRTGTLHSVEALLRWKHPIYGMINPMVTVALAEETGKIDRLGLWILNHAMEQRAAWNKLGLEDFHISVNVSTSQLNAPNFHEQVKLVLQRYNVPAHQMQIEITETAALVENVQTRNNLATLAKAGVTIAMDDFGVGHSSLLYLRTQPITTLKIDGSLSRDVVKHPANLDIIATIHDLCRLLGVDTIIEFVDNEEQLKKLTSIGAFLIQGYLYSPPVPGDEIPGFVQKLEQAQKEIQAAPEKAPVETQ